MDSLAASYRWCHDVCKRSGSSFWPSFYLLDPKRRQAVFALYAFARVCDDLSDEEQHEHHRNEQLLALKQHVTCLPNVPDRSLNPLLWPALADTVQQFKIPSHLLQDVVVGVSMDIDPKPIGNWSALEDYCYHVAGAVGLACTHIWRDRSEPPREAALRCGLAFQLTNILRDVAEDARLGRIYIPTDSLQKHQIDTAAWLAGTPSGNWQLLIQEFVAKARALYDDGWEVIHHLEPNSQRMFSLMWRSYRRLLEEVSTHVDELWRRRISLSRGTKLRLVASHYSRILYSRLPHPVAVEATGPVAAPEVTSR